MPREIITLQVGQCGNQLGTKWWDLLVHEHRKNPESRSSLFYEEGSAGSGGTTLKARCVPIDMEEGVLAAMMRGPHGSLFSTPHLVTDVSGAGNNWAVGHMEFGDKYIDDIYASVASMVEMCDSLQTFILLHSLSGGTGSGLGTRVLSMLEDEFPHVFRFCTAVMPSEIDDVVIAPYNSCFALRELIEHADCVLPLDNDALATVADRAEGKGKRPPHAADNVGPSAAATPERQQQHRNTTTTTTTTTSGGEFTVADPTRSRKRLPYDSMNSIAAQMLSNLTCSMRFPGTLNMDVNEITTNLVPYPRLHFLLSSIAPLSSGRQSLQGAKHVDAMFSACMECDHQLVNCAARQSTFLAAAMIARGADITVADMGRNVPRLRERMRMVHWNADGFKTALCSVPPLGHDHSLLMLANNCAIGEKLRALRDRFMRLYSVRSHVHHYERYLELAYFDGTADCVGNVIDDYAFLGNLPPPTQAPRSMRDLLVL